MDLNCGSYISDHAKSAVEKGKLSESDIDRALHNLFSVRMRLGLFDGSPKTQPYTNLRHNDVVCTSAHQHLALTAARDGIVLLKNSQNLLPLSTSSTKTLAVIGPNANNPETLVGNYAGPPCSPITPLQGLTRYVKETVFHRGCDPAGCDYDGAEGVAGSADHVVVVVGLSQGDESEEMDREGLELPREQVVLLERVAAAARRPVVVVVMCGGGVDVSFARDDERIGGILWAGYPGEGGGRAVAEIIFGHHNPGMFRLPTDLGLINDTSLGFVDAKLVAQLLVLIFF